jgi:hypothetical protein
MGSDSEKVVGAYVGAASDRETLAAAEKVLLTFRLKCLKSVLNNQHYCQLWWNHPRLLQREIELLERQIAQSSKS